MAASLRHHRIIIDAPDLQYIQHGNGYWCHLNKGSLHDTSNLFSLTIDNDSMVLHQQSTVGTAFVRLTATNYKTDSTPGVQHYGIYWCIVVNVQNVSPATVNLWDKAKTSSEHLLPLAQTCRSFVSLMFSFQDKNIRGFSVGQPGSIRGIKESVFYFLRSGEMQFRLRKWHVTLTTTTERQRKKDSIADKESALAQVRLKESDAEEKSRSIILQRQVNDALKENLALQASTLEKELRVLKGEKATTGTSVKGEMVVKMETMTEPIARPFSFNGRGG